MGNAEILFFETILTGFRDEGLVNAKGYERTDATHVLAVIVALLAGQAHEHADAYTIEYAKHAGAAGTIAQGIRSNIRPPAARHRPKPNLLAAHYDRSSHECGRAAALVSEACQSNTARVSPIGLAPFRATWTCGNSIFTTNYQSTEELNPCTGATNAERGVLRGEHYPRIGIAHGRHAEPAKGNWHTVATVWTHHGC